MRNFLLSVRQIFQFHFWPHRRYCHVILGQLLRKYDVISLYQDGGRGRSILFPVSHLLISLPSAGQSLWANQILSTYLNWWLRYNYFRFLKNKRPPYWKSTFGFDHLPEIFTLFCIRLQNFVQIEAPTAEIWRHIHFSRWRPRRLNTTSGFVLLMFTASEGQSLLANQILSRYLKWRLVVVFNYLLVIQCYTEDVLSTTA